ncbi:hypothetical protein DL93DRAFT_2091175 [Clavulina sp. PMI_390]|nr:hypothetical protein DL93DRAFT_2091175 [Clavulina sp. PMI_390]
MHIIIGIAEFGERSTIMCYRRRTATIIPVSLDIPAWRACTVAWVALVDQGNQLAMAEFIVNVNSRRSFQASFYLFISNRLYTKMSSATWWESRVKQTTPKWHRHHVHRSIQCDPHFSCRAEAWRRLERLADSYELGSGHLQLIFWVSHTPSSLYSLSEDPLYQSYHAH